MAGEYLDQIDAWDTKSPESDELATKSFKTNKTIGQDKESHVVGAKRKCVSTACIACRRRKSKCDGNAPSCAACASVYGTECTYDPSSDHRRKGVYRKDINNLKTRNSTLQTLVQGILNTSEQEAWELFKQIRACESLDDVAESLLAKKGSYSIVSETMDFSQYEGIPPERPSLETELSGKMGELRLDNGAVQFIGGTSNLIYLDSEPKREHLTASHNRNVYEPLENPIASWTAVTQDTELIVHLINMYMTWHYTYFTTLSKTLFFRDFFLGKPSIGAKRSHEYCTPLLVHAMLALGCHFTSWPEARADRHDSATVGDHFFKEAKRLLQDNEEAENPCLTTVQALALMSVREAGCGRESKGWLYSGMSFRMAFDLGLNIDSSNTSIDEEEIDARRITIWGCFLFDKCWSNYLGRPPQLPLSIITAPKFEVFPMEDAELWSPWTDAGIHEDYSQPARTRAIARQISSLCEISSDLITSFYHPTHFEKSAGKQTELKALGDIHTRLEGWRKNLPKEMEAREGQLPNVLVMHMFFHLLYIHLFRPFLRHNQSASSLPSHVSPRKICTRAAAMISKLLRIYKRTYGLRQICNIVVYIVHSACTIHLLNLPDKTAQRDIVQGVKHLEEIGDNWLCARRTLSILSVQIKRWRLDLPEEALVILERTDAKYGYVKGSDHGSPRPNSASPTTIQQTLSSATIASPNADSLRTTSTSHRPGISTCSPMPDSHVLSDTQLTSSSTDLGIDVGSIPLQQPFMVQQAQQRVWSPINAPPTMSRPNQSPSPTVIGSVDPLGENSQDWWLKDHSALFDNWAKMESGFPLPTGMLSNEIEGTTYANVFGSPWPGAELDGLRNNVGMDYVTFMPTSYDLINDDLYQ